MLTFDQLGSSIKAYARAMEVAEKHRQEEKRLNKERARKESTLDAYEQVDRSSVCMEFPS